jgi:hypothetical protein
LISRYFTWKLRHDAPRSQRASGRPSLDTVEDVAELAALVSRQAQTPISA